MIVQVVMQDVWQQVMVQHMRRHAERHANMFVVNATTPAQMFHALRRQLNRPFQKPLVLLTPKFLLHHRPATSALQDFTTGTFFNRVIDDGKVAGHAACVPQLNVIAQLQAAQCICLAGAMLCLCYMHGLASLRLLCRRSVVCLLHLHLLQQPALPSWSEMRGS